MATINDKMNALKDSITQLQSKVALAEQYGGAQNWGSAERWVMEAVEALRKVRSAVRERARVAMREECTHPAEMRTRKGVCKRCKQKGLDPCCAGNSSGWMHAKDCPTNAPAAYGPLSER